jgi:protein-disulfide isomerase
VVKPELEMRYLESGKVKLVWHDFAWIGQESRLAAQAARCAGRQDRFWEYHDYLFNHQRGENRGQFAAENLKSFALELKLDSAAFDDCLDRGEDLPAIQQDLAAGRTLGVNSTPYFLVNGRPFVGGSAAQLFQAVDAELARVGR